MSDLAPPTASAFPILLAGPSGAGKTTIRDRLIQGVDGDRFTFSVSMTTRAPRSGEVDGVDYVFATQDEFDRLVDEGGMLEHATVHGLSYGTPRANLDAARASGTHLLLDIDVQGARQVRASVPDLLTIFLVPPSGDRILERLRGRGSETDEQLQRRLESARSELQAASEFDYLVVNDDLDVAVADVEAIIRGEGTSYRRLGSEADAFIEEMITALGTDGSGS